MLNTKVDIKECVANTEMTEGKEYKEDNRLFSSQQQNHVQLCTAGPIDIDIDYGCLRLIG